MNESMMVQTGKTQVDTAGSGSDWAGQSMTAADSSSTVFEEPEDPSNRSFFSEIISSVSDVKFSHSGRYMLTRDYLTVKVWDLNMEARPIETYQVCIEVWRPRVCLSMWCEIAQEPPLPCTDNPQGCPATGAFFPWCSVDETAESLWGVGGGLRMGLSSASRTPTSGGRRGGRNKGM